MKRSLVLILVLVLCFFTVPVFAEEIDLGSMSLDELQTLHRRINEEISLRFPPESSPFGSGVYFGGRDIKPGSYTFTVSEVFGVASPYIQVWQSEEDFAEGSSAPSYKAIYLEVGQIATLSFAEGTVIAINNASGVISPVTASWIP